MSVLLFSAAGVLFIMLLLVAAIRPEHAKESLFELRRRSRLRDKSASTELRRQSLLVQASVLGAPLRAVLLVALSALLVSLLGWTGGLLCAFFVGLFYSRIAELPFIQKPANRLYRQNEQAFLRLVSKYKKIIRLIGGKKTLGEASSSLGSREELAHLLELSPVFSEDDKQLLENAFRFKERTVKELMTPRSKVVTVADTELLGPLVLDDLHKTGHTIFPVVKGEAVVGLLDSSDHVDLHTKESVHVRSVMHGDITEVGEDATLNEALKALLATKEQLLIVVADDQQMTGIISLKDIVRAIVGR